MNDPFLIFYDSFFLPWLQNLAEVPQDISTLLTLGVANVLCNTIMVRRYDHSDQELQNTVHIMDELLKSFATANMALIEYVPITRPFLRQAGQETKDIYNKMCTFFMDKVAEHQKTFQPETEPRDFIECYLAKMLEQPDVFTLEELEYVLFDLFTASTHTTSNTLKYAILFMVLNHDVQEKVHQEAVKVRSTNLTSNYVPGLYIGLGPKYWF